jgi:hypothetical protein
MKRIFLIIALVCFSLNISAQIDRSKENTPVSGMSIPAETNNSFSIPRSTTPPEPSKNPLFPSSKDPFSEKKEKKPINLTTDHGLLEFKQENFTPKAFKDKEVKDAHKKDQYLGDFTTSGKFVEVYCRDHEYVDGDRVRILVNGEVIYNNLPLTGGYSPILVKLKDGFNTIEFEALNQGSSGPNTAELKVFDENGQPITQNEWNLLTGAKANVIILKE